MKEISGEKHTFCEKRKIRGASLVILSSEMLLFLIAFSVYTKAITFPVDAFLRIGEFQPNGSIFPNSFFSFPHGRKMEIRFSTTIEPVATHVPHGNTRKHSVTNRSDEPKIYSKIVGVGSSVPDSVLSNKDFEKIVDTSDEWIRTRTGIVRRHILDGKEGLASLASKAARNALFDSKVYPEDLDLVILATSSPDDLFGDATSVANSLNATRAAAWDLTAACSGFVFGLITGSQFIENGAFKNVLVVGADALSRWIDWKDRNTCILFGDGAGAVVLQKNQSLKPSGLLSWMMRSDGSKKDKLCLSSHMEAYNNSQVKHTKLYNGAYKNIQMKGQDVFLFATKEVPLIVEAAIKKAGLDKSDIDWLLLHQANKRIMMAVADRLKLEHSKILSNLEEYGNTSAASIPLCLDEAVKDGKVKAGDIIVISGFGAGLSWGASVIKWG